MTTNAKAVIQNKTVTVFATEDNRHLATFARSARKSLAKRVSQWEATNDVKVVNLEEILTARPSETQTRVIPQRETKMTNETTVCGKTIKHDASGQGHAWRVIAREDIPASIVEEIEGEIIDGGMESCDDFVASNGLHYRW